jgi:phosphatidylserine/phosphatidylglycerophosphate/cardiolipin synthase-like enzyme
MYKTKFKNLIKIMLCLLTITYDAAYAAESNIFSEGTTYQTCFTPGENCTGLIVETLNKATRSVYVQAYSFTSAPIANALINLKKRNIDVQVILDKSQIKNNRYSSAKFLINSKIPTWIDYRPAIAHNKVMIIDDRILITGYIGNNLVVI